MPEPYKSQHDGYLFRHEKFGSEKLIGKTRTLQGERQNKEVFPLQISLGKLPVPGYYIGTLYTQYTSFWMYIQGKNKKKKGHIQ